MFALYRDRTSITFGEHGACHSRGTTIPDISHRIMQPNMFGVCLSVVTYIMLHHMHVCLLCVNSLTETEKRIAVRVINDVTVA